MDKWINYLRCCFAVLKSPDRTNVEVAVELNAADLVTIVEILNPRKEVIDLRRTPIVGTSKTANIS